MNIQLGISSFAYGWATSTNHTGTATADQPGNPPADLFDEQTLLDRATAFGLRLVQFGDNLPLHELPPERFDALRQRVENEGITVEVGAKGMTDARLDQYIGLARSLNSRLLRFVIDEPGYEPPVANVIALIQNALPDLERTNITLGIENHDRLTARQYADIVEQVGSPHVGICLDSVNSMGAGEGLAEVVRTLAPHTVNLHLKDFGIRRLPHLMGFQIDGRPAGRGMLDIPWLVAQLAPFGRCQTAVLEQWVVPETTLSVSIAKETEWADESVNYLITSGLFTT
jgi:3-oxoisoapionate decarboxylase